MLTRYFILKFSANFIDWIRISVPLARRLAAKDNMQKREKTVRSKVSQRMKK